jgi:3-methyladenine DNA glycosylase AlkD
LAPSSREASEATRALLALADPDKAAFLAGFFKTGKGQYGEGDRFLGLTVPTVRELVRQYRTLNLKACEQLLASPYNEARLLALLILVAKYGKGDEAAQEQVCRLFLANKHRVNNWNLVDASAPYILGAHLLRRDRATLFELARSDSLWDRRIAVLASFAFIRAGDFDDTLKLVKRLLEDKQDLMHKACGWMLREIGKRDQAVLEKFLQRHHAKMPRTMLRYAIERFAPDKRQAYLSGELDAATG